MNITGGGVGIHNKGSLTLKFFLIWKNSGRGIVNEGSLTMSNVDVADNAGLAGVENYGMADISASRIVGTHGTNGYSLGVANRGGNLVMDRVLVAANHGSGVAASIWTNSVCPVTTLTNVTVSGNVFGVSATGGDCAEMTLTHVTISANADEGLHGTAGSLEVDNSIVAKNAGLQCVFTGVVTTFHYSLLGDGSCGASPLLGNLVGVDPKLGGLSYFQGCDLICRVFNLGATKVHPRLQGSPAIDTAGDVYCTPTDQLGRPRPVDGNGDGVAACDMGAYEYKPPGATTDTR